MPASSIAGGAARAAQHRLRVPSGPISRLVRAALLAAGLTAMRVSVLAAEPAAEVEAKAGETWPVRALGSNRGARVEVINAALVERYGEAAASPGRRFLVLRMRWENTFPLTCIDEKNLSTEYRIPRLGDHLYVVADGKELLRIVEKGEDLPGHLPVRDFSLQQLGSSLEGNLLFDAPARRVESLELRFYDYAHGHFAVGILTPPGGLPSPPRPVSQLLANEVLEAGVFRVEKQKELGGEKAPEGASFVIVDFRSRSLFSTDADASAFDPKAQPGASMKVGTVADWKESRRHLQLVVDGQIGRAPLEASSLGEEPRFLPDVFTGGDVVFLAPDATASLELRCDFPNARSSTGGGTFRPRGLTLILEGQRPTLSEPKAAATIDDDVFQVAIRGASLAPDAADPAAPAALLLDATVRNVGKKGESFQPYEQLQIAAASGKPIAADPAGSPAAGPGHLPPPALLWIPEGEQRSFRLAFRVPPKEARRRLVYAGVSRAQMLELKVDEAPAAAVAAAPPTTPPPAETAAPAPAPEAAPAKEPAMQPGEASAKAPEPRPAPAAAAAAAAAAVPPPKVPPPATPNPAAPTPAAAAAQAAPPPPPAVPREPKGLAGVGLTAEQVNEAIDRGAAFLWNHLREKDRVGTSTPFGYYREHLLAALALVHAEAHEKDPAFDKALRGFLGSVVPMQLGEAYQIGLLCMTIEAFGDPAYLPVLRDAVRYLLEAQGEEGTWTYKIHFKDGLLEDPARKRVLQVSGGVPLDGTDPRSRVLARTLDWKLGQDGDNSVSQYAVLGLHAASRSGIQIAEEVWRRNLAANQSRQCKDGGWHYSNASHEGYGSMSCAGICALAIARFELGETDIASDPAIRRGLEWLAKFFTVSKHPFMSDYHYYYLYSLERVGRVLDIDFVGANEWYPLGAKLLLDRQGPDGGWRGEFSETDPRIATSFALLFLTRATPTLSAPELKRGGNGKLATSIRLPPGNRYYFILDASGSMLSEMDGKTKWEIARGAVGSLVSELPENSEVALRVYGHRKRAIDQGANEDTALEVPLRPLVKKDFLAKLEALRARGKTPIALSLTQAKSDLSSATAERPITVILLTDGGDDTQPARDPSATAAELGKLAGIRFHTVGFDIGRAEWGTQLRAMTAKAGGQYWSAARAGDLTASLRAAVFGVPERFDVADAEGKVIASGAFGETKILPEGKYTFRSDLSGSRYAEELWVNTDRTTSVVFDAVRAIAERAGGADSTPPAAAGAQPGAAISKPPATTPAAEPGTPPAPAGTPKEPAKRFCTGCGKPVAPAAKFCPSCGKKT